ncbi:MAG TPA: hypothetical protein PKG60_10060 [Spirochaetota bacterium]|nr:hypothetical protein [Spirochaetota bacterium]
MKLNREGTNCVNAMYRAAPGEVKLYISKNVKLIIRMIIMADTVRKIFSRG